MNRLFFIFLIIVIGCKPESKIVSEIKAAQEMVNETLAEVNSDAERAKRQKLHSEKQRTEVHKIEIMNGGNQAYIDAAFKVIEISTSTIDEINEYNEMIISRIEVGSKSITKKHRDIEIMNQLFIAEKYGLKFKDLITNTINSYLDISQNHQLGINKEELHLKLNMTMLREGETWEQYQFKGLPPGAIFPIFSNFRNNTISTKLQLLEKLAELSKRK